MGAPNEEKNKPVLLTDHEIELWQESIYAALRAGKSSGDAMAVADRIVEGFRLRDEVSGQN